ncbi:hypothetical protein [Terriglobus sp. RCC_193]|uniref:hypothetical protein n=1 Tax=Terriglobus sp. RCC_193 TaxID=3239218 RepID=UPI003524C35C
MRRFLVSALFVVTPLLHAQGGVEGPLPQLSDSGKTAAKQHGSVLNNDAIVKMSKAGLDDSILLQTVRSQPGEYRTGPDDLIALKEAGVSQAVITAMLAKNSGLEMHPVVPVEVTPLSVNSDDPGLYFKNVQGQWEAVGPELVKYRDGGALKSLATNNIIKKDENGVVSGPKSHLKISPGTEMMILAPGTQVDAVEYVILRFHEKSDRREFRVKTGNVFHSETGADRDALDIPIHKISSRLFGFTVPRDLQKGEYGVLAPGSAGAPGIAHAGKIYTFSISE